MPPVPDSRPLGQAVQRLRKTFFSGLALILPLGITLAILKLLAGIIGGFLAPVFRTYSPGLPQAAQMLLSALSLAALIYLVGVVAGFVIGRRIVRFVEGVLLRVPVFKSVYGAAKQVVNLLSGSGGASQFRQVVYSDFPRTGAHTLGFVTGTMADERGRVRSKVFLPMSPNLTAGLLVFAEQRHLTESGVSVEDGIRMELTCGVLGPTRVPTFRGGRPDIEAAQETAAGAAP